jgi:hypothetical protein
MQHTPQFQTAVNPSEEEKQAYQQLVKLLRNSPIPDSEILKDLPLYLTRASLGHVLFIDSIYRQIVDVPGNIFEFGVRWGRGLSLFSSLRTLYEPYNVSRKIIGLDTFEGFPSVAQQDGKAGIIHAGALAVTSGYEQYLEELLTQQQRLGPRSHVKKFELLKGDAAATLRKYLEQHPATICALAYFDFDIYKPTKECLALINKTLTKGSIVAFDELTAESFPGEAVALQEVLQAGKCRLRRDPRVPYCAYFVVE